MRIRILFVSNFESASFFRDGQNKIFSAWAICALEIPLADVNAIQELFLQQFPILNTKFVEEKKLDSRFAEYLDSNTNSNPRDQKWFAYKSKMIQILPDPACMGVSFKVGCRNLVPLCLVNVATPCGRLKDLFEIFYSSKW